MQRLNRYQIVLAVLLAVAIAEETKVAEAADQQVAATVYGHHGGFYGHGPFYGLHHRGYFGHGHGHGYRYGRSVAADVEGQESGHEPTTDTPDSTADTLTDTADIPVTVDSTPATVTTTTKPIL